MEPRPEQTGASEARRTLFAALQSTWLPVAVVFVVHLALHGAYGPHRDELYVLAAGQHPALSYVDLPALVPVIAGAVPTFGDPLFVLRLVAAVAAAITTVLAVRIAGLAGSSSADRAMVAWAASLAPGLLAAGGLYQSVVFDILASTALAYAWMAAAGGDRPWQWIIVGGVAALALWIKYTAALWVVALAGSYLLIRPDLFRRPGPWLASGMVGIAMLPALAWQLANGLPILAFLAASASDDHVGVGFADQALQLILILGPLAGAATATAAATLRRASPARPPVLASLVMVVAVLIAGAKPYYMAVAFPSLIAIGAPRLRAWRPRFAVAVALAGAVFALAVAPIALPLLPPKAMAESGIWKLRGDYADMVGWDELARTVAAIAHADGIDTVMTENVGEAGALRLSASSRSLQVVSPHLGLFFEGPPQSEPGRIVAVGWDQPVLSTLFARVDYEGALTNDLGIRNDEYGVSVWVCAQPQQSWSQIWTTLRDFSG